MSSIWFSDSRQAQHVNVNGHVASAFSSFDSRQFCTFLSVTSRCWWWRWSSSSAAAATPTSSKSDCKDINDLQPPLSAVLTASLRKKMTTSNAFQTSTTFYCVFSTAAAETRITIYMDCMRMEKTRRTKRHSWEDENDDGRKWSVEQKVPWIGQNWSLISKWQFNNILLTWSNACAHTRRHHTLNRDASS